MMKEIIIIGTGNLAREVATFLYKVGYIIKVFLDNKEKNPSKVIDNVPVDELCNLMEYYDRDIPIWIAKKKMFCSKILCVLRKEGVNLVYIVDNDFLYETNRIIDGKINPQYIRKVSLYERVVIGYMETNIHDGCNLKCAGCTHFSGLAREERKLQAILDDISMVRGFNVLNFRLLGGEPLLVNELETVLNHTRQIVGLDCKLEIVTNGLCIPKLKKQDLNAIRYNNVKINISLYESTYEIIDDIIYILNQNGIDFCINDEGKDNRKIVSTFHTKLSLGRENKGELACRVCYNNGCFFFAG